LVNKYFVRRVRWLVVAAALALVATSATLYIRVAVLTPVLAILWPLGDVPGAEATKVVYVESGQALSYATVPIMGRGQLITNTSGWYAHLAKGEGAPPAGAAAVLPAAEGSVGITLADGSALELWNYNGTHGAVVHADAAGARRAWAAQIIQTFGGVYVWHPAAPDAALRDFVALKAGGPVHLFIPSADYVKFDGSTYIMYYDYYDGASWTYKAGALTWSSAAFTELAANTPFAADGLERVQLPNGAPAYAYWPTLAYHYNPSATQPYTTYLRAESG